MTQHCANCGYQGELETLTACPKCGWATQTIPVSLNTYRAEKHDDNRLFTAAEMFRALADQIERGEVKATSAVAVIVDQEGQDNYTVRVRAANASSSEQVALLEAAKMVMFDEMGFFT